MTANHDSACQATVCPKSERSYVDALTSDIDHLNSYAQASFVGDRDAMIRSFNAISWSDKRVKEHMKKYCEADYAERKLVDDYYRILCPHYDKVQGPSFNTMSLWLKARLHMQHLKSPLRQVHH